MNKYIWEEFKRVIIKKKILLIVILIVTVAFGLRSISKTKTLEGQLQGDKNLLNIQKSGRDKADNEIRKADFSRDIVETEKEIKDKEEQLNQINIYDKSKLDEQIQKLEKENNSKNEYELLQLKYEKKHNIEKSELTPKGMYTAMETLMDFIPLFILITIVLLSDMVSGEYSPNTIKALITKPISRKKIIISKFIVSIILSTGTIIMSAIIFIVEGGIHLGFSDRRLPFDVGAKYVLDKSLILSSITSQMKYVNGSRSIIPLWNAIIELILIVIVISAAIVSVILLISTICRNSLVSSLASFTLIGGTTIWYMLGFIGKYLVSAKYGIFVKFLPIPYMIDSMGILSGDISVQLTSSINVFFVLMVCLGWILINTFLSTYVFGKRNFD
ncbi:ABC-type transport system involved in multi-copper enzyme maturation permease subunit [Clostridium algifaecis]|uniref:ABC-type transport system involved in multi-copper enzyme maturation permease subunit n=1 Tax=Clostridium algifaecis TaxID=1472040 RepID=A0ABS4KN84_9CLOT|nr:ABC transporter permease subunit [Clostridium algifaecis]MBP2031500.1 ABC-type transport system involved in multi-copper enzyme maturation permease subunit [Clostridium algifaecis]